MKRVRNEFLDNVIIDGEKDLSKSRKLDVKSSIFEDASDHQQFLNIFEIIEKSELAQIMNVCHDINKEIAEFATGNWEECGGANCDGLVSVLKEYEKFECLSCNGIFTKEKIYSCPHCNMRFRTYSNCKSHGRYHHDYANFRPTIVTGFRRIFHIILRE